MSTKTAVSVVVPSHGRHLRLRWLLNALEDQTLERERWDVVVAHDYDRETARRVIECHPLHVAGRVKALRLPPGTGPSQKRNLAWRAGAGELVAFTDDDCRPEPDWLEQLLAVSNRTPGAIIQGATRPDPLEHGVLAAPHVRTQSIDPVGVFAQTCNILYPGALLDDLGGFNEQLPHPAGEDVDLALRARAIGVPMLPAPEAIVNHAIESHTLPGIVRINLRWRDLAYLIKRHPELRSDLPLRVFWDAHHLRTTGALVALAGARRFPFALIFAAPYLRWAMGRRGQGLRRRAIALAEIPGQLTRGGAEVVALAQGSVRYRTILL
jgi:GT2 family glycosyltransferase